MIDLLILYILTKRDFTMYAIHKHIIENFGIYTNPSFGAVKPALVRLEQQECITTTKVMSEGGRLSIIYSITKSGEKVLKELLLNPLSKNPLQFFSDSRIKLACSDVLNKEEKEELFNEITTKALLHKIKAEKILDSEYIDKTQTQSILLKNTIEDFDNIVKLIDTELKNVI